MQEYDKAKMAQAMEKIEKVPRVRVHVDANDRKVIYVSFSTPMPEVDVVVKLWRNGVTGGMMVTIHLPMMMNPAGLSLDDACRLVNDLNTAQVVASLLHEGLEPSKPQLDFVNHRGE